MLSVLINGRQMRFAPGASLLDAMGAAGFHVPTLCHDDRLKPCGSCRLCTVEIRNQHRMATACNTELADGMEIVTHSPQLEAFRRSMLRLLAADYPSPSPDVPIKSFISTSLSMVSVPAGAKAQTSRPVTIHIPTFM